MHTYKHTHTHTNRTIVYVVSPSFAVSTSSLLPRALRPEEKNNAPTSSRIRKDGWCIVLRQASLFVFTINRDASPMGKPLKSPKYSFQLDFPASVSSVPSKTCFPACLFFDDLNNRQLPGVRISLPPLSSAQSKSQKPQHFTMNRHSQYRQRDT